MLRPDGALLGFFSTAASAASARFTKYDIVDDDNAAAPRAPGRRAAGKRVLQNRDIIRMFEGLRVSDSFLLKNNIREILFRKPA